MNVYPESILGCPLRSSYSFAERPSTVSQRALRGRVRYEIMDIYAVLDVSLVFDMSSNKFNGWQTWWDSIRKGQDWFTMSLVIGDVGGTLMDCHATGPFTSSLTSSHRHQIQLKVEAIPTGT